MSISQEGNISKSKVAEVEKLANTKHKKNNSNLLIYEYITSENMSDTLNGKENLLGCHYNCGTPIVIYFAEVLAYLHHTCVLPIVHKHVRSNKVFSGVLEEKVLFMYVTSYEIFWLC
jgi:hypothetical protein